MTACLLLSGIAALPAACPAQAVAPRVEFAPLEVAASADLMWSFEIKLVNSAGQGGLYPDSLFFLLSDSSPGATDVPRTPRTSMQALARGFGNLSSGDSVMYQHSMPAAFESGTLSFEIYCHRGDGAQVRLQSPTLNLSPGPLSAEHPSEFLNVGGTKVEVVVFASRKGGPARGLLFVPQEGMHARQLLSTGLQLSSRGYTVVIASMPGYGLSAGTPDAGGPKTIAALGAALDRLKREPGVDTARLGAWGVSRGADAVTALAAKRTDLAAVVLQSGYCDPKAAGGKRAATLVLHGAADATVPADRAKSFVAALEKSGTPVESRYFSGAGHGMSRPDVQRAALLFLEARLSH